MALPCSKCAQRGAQQVCYECQVGFHITCGHDCPAPASGGAFGGCGLSFAQWATQQVQRYGNRLILDPSLVEPGCILQPGEPGRFVQLGGGIALSSPSKRKMSCLSRPAVGACELRSICRLRLGMLPLLEAFAWMESQQRASMNGQLFTLHSILIRGMAQRKALVMEDALRRNMYGGSSTRFHPTYVLHLELKEGGEVHAHRWGVTPSDGRELEKRPRVGL